jgi:hypothetical protein
MGSNQSVQQMELEDDICRPLENYIQNVSNLCKEKESVGSILSRAIVALEEQLNNTDQWLTSKNSALRQELGDNIKEYSELLNETSEISIEVVRIVKLWRKQILVMKNIRKTTDNDEARALMVDFDTSITEKEPPMKRIDELIAKYGRLSSKLQRQYEKLVIEKKEARKKFWMFVGLAAISGVALAGCIAAVILSCGAAAPAVVLGAVAVTEATVATGGKKSSILNIDFRCSSNNWRGDWFNWCSFECCKFHYYCYDERSY